MLILQVILSAIAWFRGWKWYALIPLAVGIILTLLFKLIDINPSNAMTMKLVASIIVVVINLVLLMLCIFKKPTKGQKGDNSSGVTEDIERNDEMKQAEPEPGTGETVDKAVNEEPTDNNEKEIMGYEAPLQVIGTKQFYYSRGRKKKGPYTKDELVKLKLKPETLIWTEGLDKWQPLSDFDELIKTPPPIPNEVLPNKAKPWKRIAVSLALLILLFGISFVSASYIMENRRETYLRLLNDEIDKIFDGKITLCEGEEFLTAGELRPVSKPVKSADKAENIYNLELEEYKKDIQTGAIERFHSKGKIFEYQKLIRKNSGFRVEELWSEDLVYFYEATVRYGSNPPRRLVTPEEAYSSCYRGIINDNSECLTEGLSDKIRYLIELRNKYFFISFIESDQLTGGTRGTDYYSVYYERSYRDYIIKDHYTIREDFTKFLAMFGGVSIILVIFLFLVNPFKW